MISRLDQPDGLYNPTQKSASNSASLSPLVFNSVSILKYSPYPSTTVHRITVPSSVHLVLLDKYSLWFKKLQGDGTWEVGVDKNWEGVPGGIEQVCFCMIN